MPHLDPEAPEDGLQFWQVFFGEYAIGIEFEGEQISSVSLTFKKKELWKMEMSDAP